MFTVKIIVQPLYQTTTTSLAAKRDAGLAVTIAEEAAHAPLQAAPPPPPR
jgi:hypothetical protein